MFINRVQLADDIRLFGYFNNQSLHGRPESSDTGSSLMRDLQSDPKTEKNDKVQEGYTQQKTTVS